MSSEVIDVSCEAEARAKLYSCIVEVWEHVKLLRQLGATGTAVVTGGAVTAIDVISSGNPGGIATSVVITGGGGSGDGGTVVITGW